jgi:hypothetical protein
MKQHGLKVEGKSAVQKCEAKKPFTFYSMESCHEPG